MSNFTPDFTKFINESFIACVEGLLNDNPDGINEYHFLRVLDEQGHFQTLDTDINSSLLLFQKHFLLFHVLYSINHQRVADKVGSLQITPMLIRQIDYVEADTQVGTVDAVSEFYLSLDNLESATEENVNDLLDTFWIKYLKNEKRSGALEELGLSDPVTDKIIVQRYRKLVSVHHPDKGGDNDKIQAINDAYSVLIRS